MPKSAQRPVLLQALCYVVAIAVGTGFTVQGGVNAHLAALLSSDTAATPSSTFLAAFISFAVGVACLLLLNALQVSTCLCSRAPYPPTVPTAMAPQLCWLRYRCEPIVMRRPSRWWECRCLSAYISGSDGGRTGLHVHPEIQR